MLEPSCIILVHVPAAWTSWAQAILLPLFPGVHHHAQLIIVFSVGKGFHHVAQAALELLGSSDLLVLASQRAGITGVSRCDWLFNFYLYQHVKLLCSPLRNYFS